MHTIIKLLIIIICISTLYSCGLNWTYTYNTIQSSNKCNSKKTNTQMIKLLGFKKAWVIINNCSFYPKEKISIAMFIFYSKWVEYFGDEENIVNDNLNTIMIEWNDKNKAGYGYTLNGHATNLTFFDGLTLTKGWIWVKMRPENLICDSALVHELVHASIWSIKNINGDPDHMGHRYTGWTEKHTKLIKDVNNILCKIKI